MNTTRDLSNGNSFRVTMGNTDKHSMVSYEKAPKKVISNSQFIAISTRLQQKPISDLPFF